jgi:protein-S-isoprenylcysteine O-methyltransferase Ste14
MRPLVLHNEAAGLLLGGSVVFWVLVEYFLRFQAGQGDEALVPTWATLFGLIIPVSEILAVIVVIHRIAPFPGDPWWPIVVGLALVWVGAGLRIWSALVLARRDKRTAMQSTTRLVDYGPYRWLRHPSYLGAIIGFIGFGFAGGEWASLTIMTIGAVTVFLVRIWVEERDLLQTLGDEYEAYVGRTARLVPGVF